MKTQPGLKIADMKATVSEVRRGETAPSQPLAAHLEFVANAVIMSQVLEMLTREYEAKICRKTGEGRGLYVLRAKRIVKEIRDTNIQTMILDRWGENAARIFSILR